MANNADQDQLASWEANWSGSTLLLRQGMLFLAVEGLRDSKIDRLIEAMI